MDAVLSRLIAAGANEMTSVTFQTTRLRGSPPADVRRRAVVAAREKAELYCAAAGVAMGVVLAIEDVNPELLSGRYEGHSFREPMAVDNPGEPGAIDPGAMRGWGGRQRRLPIGAEPERAMRRLGPRVRTPGIPARRASEGHE